VNHFIEKKFEKKIVSEEPILNQNTYVYQMVGKEFNKLVYDPAFTNIILVYDDQFSQEVTFKQSNKYFMKKYPKNTPNSDF